MTRALVCGATGFIGRNLVRRLKAKGYFVRTVGRKDTSNHTREAADEYWLNNLMTVSPDSTLFDEIDEVYQLADEVGGRGFIGNRYNDAAILHNTAIINNAVLEGCARKGIRAVFFASSSCVYSSKLLEGKRSKEDDALPANPDNAFAWGKLYNEQLYMAYARHYGIKVRIGRYFNCYGPGISFTGGREKVIGSLCCKVAAAADGGTVEIWGDGTQSRTFIHVDDACEATIRLMDPAYTAPTTPINITQEKSWTVLDIFNLLQKISGKTLFPRFVSGPTGPRTMDGDGLLLSEHLGWKPEIEFEKGLQQTYEWVSTVLAGILDRDGTVIEATEIVKDPGIRASTT